MSSSLPAGDLKQPELTTAENDVRPWHWIPLGLTTLVCIYAACSSDHATRSATNFANGPIS